MWLVNAFYYFRPIANYQNVIKIMGGMLPELLLVYILSFITVLHTRSLRTECLLTPLAWNIICINTPMCIYVCICFEDNNVIKVGDHEKRLMYIGDYNY